MRILVTGSSGRVGRNILLDGLSEHHEVTGFDRIQSSQPAPKVRYLSGSILERKDLSHAMAGVDAVVHLAGIPYDIPPLHQVYEINAQGTYNALELAVEHKVSTFVQMSSIMVYGFGRNATPRYLPIDEEHPALTCDTYGMSKLASEQLCRAFSEKFPIRTICFRLVHFTVLCRPYPDHLPFVDFEGAEALHEYIDSRDVVSAIETALVAESLQHEVLLLSAADSGLSIPTADFIRDHFPRAEMRYSMLDDHSPLIDISKSERLLGFIPRHSWRCGSR